MTAEIALRLARVFNTSPQFWLGVHAEFELFQESQRWSEDLQRLRRLSS